MGNRLAKRDLISIETDKLLSNRSSQFRVAIVSHTYKKKGEKVTVPAIACSFNILPHHQREALIQIFNGDSYLVEKNLLPFKIKITLLVLDVDDFTKYSKMMGYNEDGHYYDNDNDNDYIYQTLSQFQVGCWWDILESFRRGDDYSRTWGLDVAALIDIFKYQVKVNCAGDGETLEIIVVNTHGYRDTPKTLGKRELKAGCDNSYHPLSLNDLITLLGYGPRYGYNPEEINAVILRSCYTLQGNPRGSRLMNEVKKALPNAVLLGSQYTMPNSSGDYSVFPLPAIPYGLGSLDEFTRYIMRPES